MQREREKIDVSFFVHSIHRPINELYVGIRHDEQTNRNKRETTYNNETETHALKREKYDSLGRDIRETLTAMRKKLRRDSFRMSQRKSNGIDMWI